MAYNIGEKPGRGNYLCPNCGCRLGEVTMSARRGVNSLVGGPHVSQTTYTVKSVSPHFTKLKAVALILVLAGLMFAGGFVTKALLSTVTPVERSGGSSANASSGLNVNTGNTRVNSGVGNVSGGNPSVTVWVNTKSGVYHCANTRWYGNTKSGEYMTQKEAQSKGYRPAQGSVCG